MDRLTERNPGWIDDELWERACEPSCEEIDNVYRKLKEYEDLEEHLGAILDGTTLKDLVRECEEQLIEPGKENPLKSRILTYEDAARWDDLKRADEQGLLLRLDEPLKPLVWGNNERDSAHCPECGKDLMGGFDESSDARMYQCKYCGAWIDTTKAITEDEAEAALAEMEGNYEIN